MGWGVVKSWASLGEWGQEAPTHGREYCSLGRHSPSCKELGGQAAIPWRLPCKWKRRPMAQQQRLGSACGRESAPRQTGRSGYRLAGGWTWGQNRAGSPPRPGRRGDRSCLFGRCFPYTFHSPAHIKKLYRVRPGPTSFSDLEQRRNLNFSALIRCWVLCFAKKCQKLKKGSLSSVKRTNRRHKLRNFSF